ncbi:DUF6105 family protein [Rhizobium rhizoryzae]|uniref:Uncharacterized protein n=1 Tax=Rhizobium rhizoryzae TaxID=451876 RepID=A0A7W6LDL9_9HYPH|nr:DUF6105 family protein [Rhizobium rhizoryzae]MBB4142444.1 hypothetical protein [Rhizobium rhizoryzae]
MKWFLILWAGPVAFLGAWYWLSYYNISFGFFMLTRDTHDLVFQIYGQILGIDPALLPMLVVRAVAVDSLIVLAILAFRRRKQIHAWWIRRYASSSDAALSKDTSLSKAP